MFHSIIKEDTMTKKTGLAVAFALAVAAAPIVYQIPDAVTAQIASDKREYAALTIHLEQLVDSHANFARAALTAAAALQPDGFAAPKTIVYKTAAGQSETATLKFNNYSVVRNSAGDRLCTSFILSEQNLPKTFTDIDALQSELVDHHYPYRNILSKSDLSYEPSMFSHGGTVCLPKRAP
jgi:hypothetical protein